MDEIKSGQIMWAFAIIAFALHLFTALASQYGIFRDELYYVACANHLQLGYVDHPPLSVWILAGWKFLFGESLFSIRFLPAIFGGLTVAVTCRLAREMGGELYAQALTGMAALVAPIYLGFFGLYSMNALDILLWSVAFLLLIKLLQKGENRYWYFFGLVIGLGVLNKISMLWLAAGIAAGVLLTPMRASLKQRAPWAAMAIVLLLFLPFIIWNITHDFAHLEFIRRAAGEKYASQNPITFFAGLILLLNPFALPLWAAGFWTLLSRRDMRLIGIAVSTVLFILLVNIHSKAEYFTPATTVLFPAGAVVLEKAFDRVRTNLIKITYLSAVVLLGFFLLPLTRDVLPVENFIRYQASLGIPTPSTEGHEMGALPQHYADRFGWENMTHVVARVYAALPDSDRRRCLIYGRNYGEAAAIDYFGKMYNLPPAISQHNSYYYWSQKHLTQDVTLIVIGRSPEELAKDFDSVEQAATIESPHAMPYENHLPVTICRGLRPVFELAWADGKLFI